MAGLKHKVITLKRAFSLIITIWAIILYTMRCTVLANWMKLWLSSGTITLIRMLVKRKRMQMKHMKMIVFVNRLSVSLEIFLQLVLIARWCWNILIMPVARKPCQMKTMHVKLWSYILWVFMGGMKKQMWLSFLKYLQAGHIMAVRVNNSFILMLKIMMIQIRSF